MRTLFNTAGLLILIASAAFIGLYLYEGLASAAKRTVVKNILPSSTRIADSNKRDRKLRDDRLSKISAGIRHFSKTKGYNSRIVFLADMSIPSGENRFFIYNMDKDSIEKSALVTHGYGSQKNEIEFSNVPGSYCTSLGKYKVGAAYNGRFGLAYKLHGLDKTNDKAFERFVVLHAHDCVPEVEVTPAFICESQGCPTVAPAFLQVLKQYIEASDKPILLNIYK